MYIYNVHVHVHVHVCYSTLPIIIYINVHNYVCCEICRLRKFPDCTEHIYIYSVHTYVLHKYPDCTEHKLINNNYIINYMYMYMYTYIVFFFLQIPMLSLK